MRKYHELSKKFGIDVSKNYIEKRISDELLPKYLMQYSALLRTTKPILHELYDIVKDTGFFLELLSPEGVILFMLGDEDILRSVSKRNMSIGTYMDIKSAGTNAISVCMAEKRPCQLIGDEHYLEIFKGYTCSCAPIEDSRRQILGYINLNGYIEQAHTHTLGLVVAAVNSIQNQLKYENNLLEIDEANRITHTVIESMHCGILTIDPQCKIEFINSHAKKLLHDYMAVGNNLNTYFEGNEIMQSCLNQYELDEILLPLKLSNEQVFIESRYIIDGSGSACGFVVTLKPFNTLYKMAGHFVNLKAKNHFRHIQTHDTFMISTLKNARSIAKTPSNIHIYGESGVGKTTLAEAIHNGSKRSKMPFAVIDCRESTEEDIIFELFGTGQERMGSTEFHGKVSGSSIGTLLIKSLENLPEHVQILLLKHLRSLEAIGEKSLVPKFITTSTHAMETLMKNNLLHRELYYELAAIEFEMPPLRKRAQDIPLLIDHFLIKYGQTTPLKKSGLTKEAYHTLKHYDYPGNINEMQMLIQRVIHLDGKLEFDLSKKENQPTDKYLVNFNLESYTLKELEEIAIRNTLQTCNYNYKKAAETLGISRATLYNKLKKINECV